MNAVQDEDGIPEGHARAKSASPQEKATPKDKSNCRDIIIIYYSTGSNEEGHNNIGFYTQIAS